MTDRSSRLITGRTARHNVQRFLTRHQLENEHMRAQIYETLRKRFGLKEASPQMLESAAVTHSDDGAKAMLEACTLMLDAHHLLLSANLVLVQK